MTTTALLIRHAHTDVLGRRLVGRLAGLRLRRKEVHRLQKALRAAPLHAIYSSPLERALETAQPLAAARRLVVQVRADLNEVDFGDWTGLSFAELATLPAWQEFNSDRATARVPHGESAADVQSRIVAALDALRTMHEGKTFAVVSHADVIRSAILRYTGTSLNLFHTVQIDPASVTAVALGKTARLLIVNSRGPFGWATPSALAAAGGTQEEAGP
jgi:broad specificity phosphatase PhoE